MSAPTWLAGPPKKVLLATDLSSRCDRALDRASALARLWNAGLVAAHVLEPHPANLKDRGEETLSWRRPPRQSARVAEQIRRDLVDSADPVTVRVAEGDPAERIEEIAREEGCGLIVTGVARDETFGRYLLGATVDRLIRRSRIPVLVVKARGKRAYGKIVVATDFSEASLHALDAALAFFPKAEIALLHAYEVPFEGLVTREDYREQWSEAEREASAAFLAKSKATEADKRRIKVFVEHGSPPTILRAYVEDHSADLVVVGSHGRSAMFDVLIGSTARRIVETARGDVLLVREPRAVPVV